MKKLMTLLTLVLVAGLSIGVLLSDTDGTATVASRALTFQKYHNVPLSLGPVGALASDTLTFASIELRGTWNQAFSGGTGPWPSEALTWYKNTSDDNPLAPLNWTGVGFDTAAATFWSAADLGGGVGKYTASQKLTNIWALGNYSNPTLPGWLGSGNGYTIEVFKSAAGVPSASVDLLLGFNPATGDTLFRKATYELIYAAEGRGTYPVTTGRPTSLRTGNAEARIRFETGSTTKKLVLSANTDTLVFKFKTLAGTVFATVKQPVTLYTTGQAGSVPGVTLNSPVPGSGYFSAGDVINLNVTVKDSAGTSFPWYSNPSANGISRMEILVSGPKKGYSMVFPFRQIVNNFILQYDSLSGTTYNSSVVKIKLPTTLPGGPGTYTVFLNARRMWGTQVENATLLDFQVGTTAVDQMPVSSNVVGQSCAACHGLNGPVKHHGGKGVEQCLPCHADNTLQIGLTIPPFTEIIHVDHQKGATYPGAMGDCTTCHLNNSQNQFTKNADVVCKSCHNVIPYYPLDHNVIPLSGTGFTCATANCHAGGTLGVFKNIAETHAGLAAKYTGGTIAAKKTPTPPTIDGAVDPMWNMADSMITKTGITVKFLYDTNNVYAIARWKDGNYKMYAGGAGTQVAPTKSLNRNRWSFDGTNWTKSGDEDRLAFIWDMGDGIGANCSKACHSTSGHTTATGKIDNWHWKAQRTNPLDYADDQYWSTSGRKNDAAVGSFGADNLNATLTAPIYSANPATGNTADFLYLMSVQPFVATGWTSGATIPGWAVNDSTATPISGSRSDIRAKGVFDAATGYWTVEFKRKLNTGNTDDCVFDLASTRKFAVTMFDNVGANHASQGVDVGVYTLSFSSVIIPVEMVSFRADANGSNVVLNWKTATEKNNSGFEVERTIKNSSDWKKIGFVAGNGTTTKISNYTFTDKNVNVSAKYIYRLKQIDLDGNFNYSASVEVNGGMPEKFELGQNYPNPFNPSTKIVFSIIEKAQVKLTVYDISGATVETIVNENMDPGFHEVMFNASKFSSGVYFYRLEAGKNVSTKKMLLLK